MQTTTSLASIKKILGDDYLILDTETTGLGPGEIIQIAIIDQTGQSLLNTLVKPVGPIPTEATSIHGITTEMCEGAPSWAVVREQVLSIIANKNLLVYNANYDRKMCHFSDEAARLEYFNYREHANWACVMQAYAERRKVPGPYGGWRWHKLTEATAHEGIKVSNAHSALGDCLMTLELCKVMA
jgi:DNA polymerase III subunit epsilon